MKQEGEATCFLGMMIMRNEDGTVLQVQQTKVVTLEWKSVMGYQHQGEVGFRIEEGEVILEGPCRSLACSLMYLAVNTRPDLSFSVSVLDKPINQTWQKTKRVLQYLSESSDF